MKCAPPPLPPECQSLGRRLSTELLETRQAGRQAGGENEIIVTITPSKAAVSKTIKPARCQETDLGDWLQHAWHSSVTWCFVIFPTETLEGQAGRIRGGSIHTVLQGGVIIHVCFGAKLFLFFLFWGGGLFFFPEHT